ncbi:MAG: YihY family inner membrane protein [Pseudomonadota bacterium]
MFLWRMLSESFLLFFRQRYYTRCSALTYTSLLGFIPLISVLIAVFSKMPFVKDQLPKIQSFVFHNFLPGQGEKLLDYIEHFTEHATKLPWTQFVFLIVISGALVISVDRTINHVWDDKNHRRAFHTLLRSWIVIMLTTIFLGLSLMFSSYLLSAPLWNHLYLKSILQDHTSWWLPFLSSFAGFSIFYIVMPNQKVRVKHALIGGFVVSILFEIMKHGFAWYIHSIPTYNAIYGALAVIPLFMIWIYSFWCIVVYGALVTHQLEQTPRNIVS